MKLVYKCDYCTQMGTEEEIKEHELQCVKNYDRKSCHTCVHKQIKSKDGQWFYECKLGKEFPVGSFMEFCAEYERNTTEYTLFENIFNNFCRG